MAILLVDPGRIPLGWPRLLFQSPLHHVSANSEFPADLEYSVTIHLQL
jgi:hypothetical protein